MRANRGLWLPPTIALIAATLLGFWTGDAEVRHCGSHLGPFGLIFGTFLLTLAGVALGVGGLLAAAIGRWRKEPKTIRSGFGVLLAGFALPATFFVVTATVRATGCSQPL